ncbi:hypothetical protein G3A_02060 [Bacillus sp. 17376]|uniref:Uncharacterized protein n=1 Tax=Mesobacillus boroniphilus JCM 21738 TaxID=1294265 RepID=W4RUJ9_9BACI|nr:hypothetical protein [Mesobacillus boroniphilus]ESU34233.1 hypothetical protein G3A_02060 [Bacillus sp. 17376]GAE47329.1 hypothetical protein JCM21738_4298 [Mesobacillus boroniphilus JCM 21738]
MLLLLRELDKLIYSIQYVQKGWKSRRHVYYNLDTEDHNIEIIADWILFDPEGNPHLCIIEEENKKEESSMISINNQITNIETLYKELGYNKTVHLKIFKNN